MYTVNFGLYRRSRVYGMDSGDLTAFDWQSVLAGLCSAAVQGVLVAGASVYVNQVVKQAGKEE